MTKELNSQNINFMDFREPFFYNDQIINNEQTYINNKNEYSPQKSRKKSNEFSLEKVNYPIKKSKSITKIKKEKNMNIII